MNTMEREAEKFAAKANELADKGCNKRCISCKQGIFFLHHGFAIRKGHVYSGPGRRDVKIINMCEFCFDEMSTPAERGEDVWFDPDAPRDLPLEGQLLQVAGLFKDNYGGKDGRYETTDLDKAVVITSQVEGPGIGKGPHRPVLDIDFPVKLIPSSTEGHYHLYLDVEIPHDKYMALLDAMGEAGILEPGYVSASKDRGYTAARLPWVKKALNDGETEEPFS